MRDTRVPVTFSKKPPENNRQSLATGFRDVDRSGDTSACSRCLDLIAETPFFRELKEDSFRIIADTSPSKVLDAGCGAGTDVVTLASRLLPDCQVYGIDASNSLIARAAERIRVCKARCSLILGNLTHIPCKNGVFDACRVDRVLQHICEPKLAISELVRVTAPGGMLVAFDNDWDTFWISLDDREQAETLSRFWRDSFASGRIGRDLPELFRDAGLTGIVIEQRDLVLKDSFIAGQIFDLPDLIDRAENGSTLTSAEAGAVRTELRQRAEDGTFSSGYTGFLVSGKKPGN